MMMGLSLAAFDSVQWQFRGCNIALSPRRNAMLVRRLTIAAAFIVAAAPAAADPDDRWEKQMEKRAECDEKLYEAKSRRDFYKKADECNRELAKLDREQRREADRKSTRLNSSH